MIKFFRKIRKQLVTENKFTKYLIYAIGEIILVVVGILIALQINNANESQKRELLKNTYLESLVMDLSKDTLSLGMHILKTKNNLKSLDTAWYNMGYITEDLNFDSIVNYAKHYFDPLISIYTNYNNNTYKTLISSGDISLFDFEITKELMELDRLQRNGKEVQSANEKLYFSHQQEYMRSYLWDLGALTDVFIWRDMDKGDFLGKFMTTFGTKHYLLDKDVEINDKIKEQTELILSLLVSSKT